MYKFEINIEIFGQKSVVDIDLKSNSFCLVVIGLYIYNGNTITPFSIFYRLDQKIPQLQQCVTPREN